MLVNRLYVGMDMFNIKPGTIAVLQHTEFALLLKKNTTAILLV